MESQDASPEDRSTEAKAWQVGSGGHIQPSRVIPAAESSLPCKAYSDARAARKNLGVHSLEVWESQGKAFSVATALGDQMLSQNTIPAYQVSLMEGGFDQDAH